ncbi:MAG: hypothetical protein M3O82_09485 [Verrucomicrobiota bacterium]|nr:hypothetical protein [Verrucomicrobiota bacterium]
MLGFFAALQVHQHSARELLLGELTASHVRSLLATHLMDVASADQHTVKPWFDGKLDFAPPVKDLAEWGYPLAGGRLDYVSGRTVAALVYKRQKHFINLFIWPSDDASPTPRTSMKDGYNLATWSNNGMTFWAVSDVNQSDLLEFANLLEHAIVHGPT